MEYHEKYKNMIFGKNGDYERNQNRFYKLCKFHMVGDNWLQLHSGFPKCLLTLQSISALCIQRIYAVSWGQTCCWGHISLISLEFPFYYWLKDIALALQSCQFLFICYIMYNTCLLLDNIHDKLIFREGNIICIQSIMIQSRIRYRQ